MTLYCHVMHSDITTKEETDGKDGVEMVEGHIY